MKIFDSLNNKKWSGRGIEIKSNSLFALKSANFTHPINIRAGKYIVKIVGKKRTGSGKITIEILSDQNEIFLKEEINFSNNSWAELTFPFDSNRNVGTGKIRFTREKKVYGSIEIGRVYIDLLNDLPVPKTSSIASRRKNIRGISLPSKLQSKKSFDVNNPLIQSNKKIAFIVPYHIYGGAEVYIQNIINNLEDIPVTILYMKENNLQNNITNSNVIHRVIKNQNQLQGILKSSMFDYIVYYNRLDIYNMLSQMKIRGDLKSKLIEIYHSDFIWAGSLASIKKRIGIDKLITISDSLALDIDGITIANREVIPIGIDIDKFSPKNGDILKRKLGIIESKTVIGTVARLSKEKQIDYLIDLASEAVDFEFVIVGDGPERNNLLNKIQKLNINNVHLVGYQKNVSQYYNIFDAFVLASKMEGTPISIIESMASGVPVFTNMIGAIPDLITDGQTGFKIYNDPVIDAGIIRQNMDNFDVIKNARTYIKNNHDISKVYPKFLKAILSLNNFFEERKDQTSFILRGEYI